MEQKQIFLRFYVNSCYHILMIDMLKQIRNPQKRFCDFDTRICCMRCSSTSQRLLILTLHFHTGIAQFLQCAVSAYHISECHSQLATLPPLLQLLLPIQPAVIHAQGTFILKPELPVTLTESSAPVPSCSLAKPHSQNQWHSLSHHQC